MTLPNIRQVFPLFPFYLQLYRKFKLSWSNLDPGTMIELNLSDDLDQTILKAFDEMRAEARSRQ